MDFIQIIPDHYIVPVALRILPAIAQDLRTVSVVRASLLSLIALCPTKLAACSDILRDMQGDSQMLPEDLPFWAAVAQEPGAPLGTIGVYSSATARSTVETCLPAKSFDQEKGERQKGADVQTKKKKKGASALMKGLRNGEVSKLVDEMEAKVEAPDVKKAGLLVGEMISQLDSCELLSKQKPQRDGHRTDGLQVNIDSATAPPNGLRNGEACVGDQTGTKTKTVLPNQSCLDVPTLPSFDDFWKHYEDMPMLDRFTLSLQEDELKKMRDAGAGLRNLPQSSWLKSEVGLASNRTELRSLMDQGVSFQLDMDPASRQL